MCRNFDSISQIDDILLEALPFFHPQSPVLKMSSERDSWNLEYLELDTEREPSRLSKIEIEMHKEDNSE